MFGLLGCSEQKGRRVKASRKCEEKDISSVAVFSASSQSGPVLRSLGQRRCSSPAKYTSTPRQAHSSPGRTSRPAQAALPCVPYTDCALGAHEEPLREVTFTLADSTGALMAIAATVALTTTTHDDDNGGGSEESANDALRDRKSTRLNSSHSGESRMPSSA